MRCSIVKIRPFADRPDIELDWMLYAVPETNPTGPRNVFGPTSWWDSDEVWERQGVGTLPRTAQYYGGPIPKPDVTPLVGSPREWVEGLSYEKWINGGYKDPAGCAPVQAGDGKQIRQRQQINLTAPRPTYIRQAQGVRYASYLTVPLLVRQAQDEQYVGYLFAPLAIRQAQDAGYLSALSAPLAIRGAQDVAFVLPPPEDEVLLATSNFSGVASVDLTGITGYSFYKIVGYNLRASGLGGGSLTMRTSANGGSTFAASGSDYVSASGAASAITVMSSIPQDNQVYDVAQFEMLAGGLSGTAIDKLFTWTYGTNSSTTFQGSKGNDVGCRLSTSLVDALRFIINSGTMSGSLRVYGYN